MKIENFFNTQENKNPDKNKMIELSFFFGAGASVKAGVPTTYSFVAEFVDGLKSDREAQNIVKTIIEKLSKRGVKDSPDGKVDIELLLEAIDKLINKDKEILLEFYKEKSFLPELSSANFKSLQNTLIKFIKSKVMVNPDKVMYLEPLKEFIPESGALDIYSANYDTCVETFCSEWRLVYKDGFDESWNPKIFDETNIDFRLFKIHGSITWFRSNTGRFLKIPIKTSENPVELYTGEVVNNLMLYPAQKYEYVEPLFELLIHMKKQLESCRILFVIGYSFRDDHIRNILWDVARKNRDFHIVLIDPEAKNIFNNRLKFYEDGKTESLLNGRVICLPYYFEKVFPDLKNEILYKFKLSLASKAEGIPYKETGTHADWELSLVNTAELGDTETLQGFFEKLNQKEEEYYNTSGKKIDMVSISKSIIIALMYVVCNRDKNLFSYFWSKFTDYFDSFFERISVHPDALPPYSAQSIVFKSKESHSQYSYNNPISREMDIFKKDTEIIKKRIYWMKNSPILDTYISMMDDIYKSLTAWSKDFSAEILQSNLETQDKKEKFLQFIKKNGRDKIVMLLTQYQNQLNKQMN